MILTIKVFFMDKEEDMSDDKIIKFPSPGTEMVRIKTKKCSFHKNSIMIPRSFFYQLKKYANDLYISGDNAKLVLTPGAGDSLALIRREESSIYLVIPPDLQDELALFDGDILEVSLVRYRYQPPEIHLRLAIEDKD